MPTAAAVLQLAEEVTIAGNLQDMLRQVAAVGADTYVQGGKICGSVLIERMKVGGT